MAHPRPFSVAVIGAGPGGTSLIERLVANAAELLPRHPLHLHVVDPHPPGAGRVWRREQSPLLWANSLASDITLFTDEAATCEGPIAPGPSLWEWGRDRAAEIREGRTQPALAPYADELSRLTPVSFPSRPLLSAYLAWVFRATAASAPPNVRIIVHRDRAVDLTDGPFGRQQLELAGGTGIVADAVVLAQGHLDHEPDPSEREFVGYARENGLTYLPRGYAADQDLGVLAPGEPVIVRGLGLAFVDLMVRVSSGRGGRFGRGAEGVPTYHPSGNEPVLYVGSRRGVPYRAKTGYELTGDRHVPRFLAIETFDDRPGPRALEWHRDIRPALDREMLWAYYQRLFTAHRDRTTADWADVAEPLAEALADGDHAPLVNATVPGPDDRLDLGLLDRPLLGRRFADATELQEALLTHMAADLARRSDPRFSADLAVIHALLVAYGVIARLLAAGRISDSAQLHELSKFHNYFSYIASGPPGPRLAEMAALAEAGVIRFVGPDTAVAARDGAFVAHSPAVPGVVRARALVEARLPEPALARTLDPLLRRLYARGAVSEELLAGVPTGKVRTEVGTHRLVDSDGIGHNARFATGHGVAGGVAVGGFARPRFDAPTFRVNDSLARDVLRGLAASAPTPVAAPTERLTA
ncbi:FAD/NAD(P)-binding protein [Streptodolium elevatio]